MLKQTLQQKLLQKLSPQQIQLMKLLQVPSASLDQRIKEELEQNPALEEGKTEEESIGEENYDEDGMDQDGGDDSSQDEFDISDYLSDDDIPSYKLNSNNSSSDDERREVPITGGLSFQDVLISQLSMRLLDDHHYKIAVHLIGSLDGDGYLRRPLEAIVDDMAFTQNVSTTKEELEEVLHEIQELDPPGVGARSLQECLLLQLQRRSNHDMALALAVEVIRNHFEEFSKKHYSRIARKLGITEEELKPAVDIILKLNPKPGNTVSEGSKASPTIVPDFIIDNNDGVLNLSLNARNAPDLRVSRTYADMLEGYSKTKDKTDKSQKEAVMFVRQKLDAAKWFIDAIKQRQQTLMKTMTAIMEYQYDYFLEGDETMLKPMILKDIAEKVELDISTISRVANSKYVQTPFGTFLLKTFFSESLQTDSGEEVSTREVKKILQECIDAENKKKPLTDDRLTKILKEKGYNIARRTIAKYREQLGIPVARLRKEL